ncbi:MAG: T9SS type A sorting domain-containing protein [Ignavibacteriales bacterium]|nr:MAG: T9SS type A sorting domain-containing protein [Ignavibacteriales bacterium]
MTRLKILTHFPTLYPNPFNPTTTINYDLPTADFVTLAVYDILANEITTLVNEFQQAGSHKIIFDASTLSSSIYFYILKTQQHTSTQKMLYLK